MNLVNKILLIFTCLFLVGCFGTITPPDVKPIAPSYDGSERNSGFFGWETNNTIVYGVISEHARNRYNVLIENYGKRISPPLSKDYGITDRKTNCLITLEALSDFSKMNRWRKNELKP